MRATRHVLHIEARGRAYVAAAWLALHGTLINGIDQRKALAVADALQRRMYGMPRAETLHIYDLDRRPPCRQQNSPSYRSTPCP